MNILYATDNKFVPIMGVSITSLFESNKDMDEINVYVLGIDISQENEQKLADLAEQYGHQIVFIDASEIDAYLDDVGAREWGGGRATWYRCFVGRILPDEVNTVLYIDCDTIFLDSLSELSQIELEAGKALAMAVAEWDGRMPTKCLGLSESDPYYQAAVILFNLNRWREMRCEEKLLPIISKYGKDLPFVDQCAINCALHKYIQELPMKYNIAPCDIGSEGGAREDFSAKKKESINEAIIAPVIIHYASPSINRPWYRDCTGAYMKEWLSFKKISLWKDEPLWEGDSVKNHPQKNRIKDFCRKVMRFINPKLEDFLWKKIAKSSECTFCTRNMPCAEKRGQ